MKIPIDTIIFDFDGVLVDTSHDLLSAVNYAMRSVNRPELSYEGVKSAIGGSTQGFIRKCLGDGSQALVEQATLLFLEYYDQHNCEATRLFPGVLAALDAFKAAGKRLGIATQKEEPFARNILKYVGINTFFDVVVGPESVQHRKPHPEPVLRVLERTATAPVRAVMVGDMAADIQSGRAAGVHTCAVTYGFGSPEELLSAAADFTIDRLGDLLDYFG